MVELIAGWRATPLYVGLNGTLADTTCAVWNVNGVTGRFIYIGLDDRVWKLDE